MGDYLLKIRDASLPIIEAHDKILIDVKLRKDFGVNIISIIIDDPVTFTLDIDEVATINREILEIVNDDIPDGYYLEITTLGVERELLNESDYDKAIGKYVYIKTYQKIDTALNLKEFQGDLISHDSENFTIESIINQRKKILLIPKTAVAKIRLAVKF